MPNDHQNLYDNDEFFAGYARARENPVAMNYTVEQPAIRALLDDEIVKGARTLDLGCGAGDFARWLVDKGAESVLGVDPSSNMLDAAKENPSHEIEFRQAFVEEIKRRDLLASKDFRLDLPAGGSQQVTGLRIIEEEKFDALPDEAILEWRRRDRLPLGYWHWASMDNFFTLPKRGGA